MMSLITNPRERSSESMDRITNIPDCLKTKILSCLPTKDAVRTCVLSKEWEQSWTSVTNLDFHVDLKTCEAAGKGTESFTSFVTRLLLLRDKAYLQRFRLSGYEILSKTQPQTQQLINSWIAAALRCNVEEIDLFVLRSLCINSNSGLFLGKTLVVLKLKFCGYILMPKCVCLPRLKTLYLEDVYLEDDMSISSLLSGCPVLEELKLCTRMGFRVGMVNITAPVLTILIIEHLQYERLRPADYEILIDTPSLRFLNITDEVGIAYKLKNLSNLKEAVIFVGSEAYTGRFQNHKKALRDLLSGVSHLQHLVLPWESVQAIMWYNPVLPTFTSLTYMEVSTSCKIGWEALLKLLDNSPRLETLCLKLVYVAPGTYDYFGNPPPCLLSHLKVITFDEFCGFEEEMNIVKYFLLNAKVLGKLTVAYKPHSCNSEECTETLEQLEMWPRSSATCSIEVS